MPRVVLDRLATAPDEAVQHTDGTVVFVDISGFTKLSERLARAGREGAEHLTDAINSCFSALLADAYANGGALLKFGGDALLLWFEGEDHPLRGCASAVAMRSTLRSVGRVRTGSTKIALRMSVGVHSGIYESFLVGGSHREYVIAGPAATRAVSMEAMAASGQILVSHETARVLPGACLGRAHGDGVLLARSPLMRPSAPPENFPLPGDAAVAQCLSTALRAHVLAAPAAPEHRTATIAFLQYGEFDELIVRAGADTAARALDELVRVVQEAADLYKVCLLGSDIAAGGGKLILTAGAPCAVGDDEERMLLALRHVVEAQPRLPVRAGVNRGEVFAGEIGPRYRRTYTVMGDPVNLAARLMAAASWGAIYASPSVIDRSQTQFETTGVPPFLVKGKAGPVQAWELGPIRRVVRPGGPRERLPLVAREREVKALRDAIARAREGYGSLIEIVGETGSGKSRLLTEARDLASGMSFVHTTCETYTQSVPYRAWRDPLRQVLGLTWDDADEVVLRRLRAQLESSQPDLVPWIPLLAIAIDVEAPPTREVQELAEDSRAIKLHEVVGRFLAPALRVPTLVQIEHAHLMDEASSALLAAFSNHLADSAWLLIVTRRDSEDGVGATEGAGLRLELGPLAAQDALALAESTPEANELPPHMLELAVQRSGGSPEFLLDLLAAAAGGSDTLPDSIDSAATARIDALDARDRPLVRRAAVLGLSFHAARLREVLEPGAPQPDEAMWRRLSGVFARDPDGHVRFKRPALREAAYQSLPFRVRRELHGAIAQSLERDSGRDVDADPAVLSLHYILAGDHGRAWKHALTGAERASDHFANADAARLYRRAIEAGAADGAPAADLARAWEALGEALRRSGEPRAAAEALTSARRLCADDPITQARLCCKHAQVAQRSERLTAAVRWIKRGLRALEGSDEESSRAINAQLLAALANVRQRQGRPLEAAELCRRAISQAEKAGELRALAHASYVLDEALFASGRVRAGESQHSIRALEIYARLGDPEQEHKVLNNLGGLAYWAGDWDRAVELYRRAASCSERAGKPADTAYTDCNIGEILSDQGQLVDAATHLERSRRVWSSTGDRQGVAWANLLLGRVAVREGRHDAAVALLRSAEEELRRYGLDADADLAVALIAEAEALGGDPLRVLEITDRQLPRADNYRPLLHRARGLALARLGHDVAAVDQLEASIAAAREQNAELELAATIDALEGLGAIDPGLASERDAVVDRLRIERSLRPEGPLAGQPG